MYSTYAYAHEHSHTCACKHILMCICAYMRTTSSSTYVQYAYGVYRNMFIIMYVCVCMKPYNILIINMTYFKCKVNAGDLDRAINGRISLN